MHAGREAIVTASAKQLKAYALIAMNSATHAIDTPAATPTRP